LLLLHFLFDDRRFVEISDSHLCTYLEHAQDAVPTADIAWLYVLTQAREVALTRPLLNRSLARSSSGQYLYFFTSKAVN
jgi:hypothetical protein